MPRVSAEGFGEQTTEFVLPSSFTVTGTIRPPPGLTKVDEAVKQDSEETHAEALQDLPRESTKISKHSSASAGVKHGIDEPEPLGSVAGPAKSLRPDPDSHVADSSPKAQCIPSIVGWIAAAVGVGSARTKDGFDVPVSMSYDSEEYQEELKLSEPLLWDITRDFPEDAQKAAMKKEMGSMREFNMYMEISIEQVSEEQQRSAMDLKWVKRWKSESEMRMRLVACGCFQEDEKLDSDSLFASTPSLLTLRLMLALVIARNWSCALADISTAFLRAPLTEEVFVWTPQEF